MTVWKLPPKSKIYEALTAFGDGRIKIKGSEQAEVLSSDLTKVYQVRWSKDFRKIISNDNASHWQGYMGYPIIAVLMELGKLNFNKDTAKILSGIKWKQINRRFKNNYDKALEHVLDGLKSKAIDIRVLSDEIDKIMAQLASLEMEKLPRKERPQKS